MKKIRDIRVINSLSGKKELLETLESGKLTMYSCGPTVYGLIHIGNLRAALVADLFFRYFKHVGYDVHYVRNYTDIDDKIIQRAEEEGISASEVARKYTEEVEKDYALAGLLEPTHKTKATEHISEMHEMISTMIEKGNAYVVDGEVFFSVESFQDYGKLSGKETDDLIAGVRIEVDQKKKNPLDFSLWKPAKPGEPSWESPWGPGRPGWHIECSAMARKWLGDKIDIHHGGQDLVFPHHENEIAQSEACTGQIPFVRYWLHNAFVTMSKQKMAKSVGNVLNAREFLAQYGGEFSRFFFLSVNYRAPLDFSDEAIDKTLKSLERIYETKKAAIELKSQTSLVPDPLSETAWGEFVASCEKTRKEISDAFAHDLNTAGALGAFFILVREFNRLASDRKLKKTAAMVLGASQWIEILENDLGAVLGIGRSMPDQMLRKIEEIKKNRSSAQFGDRPSSKEIEALIQKRKDARSSKDFKLADQIRDELDAKGVVIKDSPAGTTWSYK